MIPFPFNRAHGMIKAHSQSSSCWSSISCLQPVCPWCVPMYKSNPNWPLGWRCREVREMGIQVSSTGYPGGLPASFPISCTNRHWFFEVLVYFFLLLRVRRIYISDFPEKRAILNQPSKSLEYRMFIPSKLRKHVENESIPFKFSSWLLLVPISLPPSPQNPLLCHTHPSLMALLSFWRAFLINKNKWSAQLAHRHSILARGAHSLMNASLGLQGQEGKCRIRD